MTVRTLVIMGVGMRYQQGLSQGYETVHLGNGISVPHTNIGFAVRAIEAALPDARASVQSSNRPMSIYHCFKSWNGYGHLRSMRSKVHTDCLSKDGIVGLGFKNHEINERGVLPL